MKPDSSAGATLNLRKLVKSYSGTTVVDGISLDVAPGEFVTLLGPSGSGKTTTLNMIAGFCSVTAGDILMDGNPIARLKPHKRNIGVVFQHYALFPHMTVTENVAFPLKQRRLSKERVLTDVTDALDLVKLRPFGDRYPGQLSGGQQQRVALARALVFRPRLLLMDEPLGALDKNLREALQLEIKRIHREVGISFVYVTHDQEEALGLSDRIAIFNRGRIDKRARRRIFMNGRSLSSSPTSSVNQTSSAVTSSATTAAPNCSGMEIGCPFRPAAPLTQASRRSLSCAPRLSR